MSPESPPRLYKIQTSVGGGKEKKKTRDGEDIFNCFHCLKFIYCVFIIIDFMFHFLGDGVRGNGR